MTDEQIIKNVIKDANVLKAIKTVPRHEFVPKEYINSAYEDGPLPIGHGQTISQLFIVAFMTDHLELNSTHKVLEIGTGSGYQTAILSILSKHVYSIEIIDDLLKESSIRLKKLGYDNITLQSGDGYKGIEQEAPFDRIIITAAPEEVPDTLLAQLNVGGIMVVPIGKQCEIQHLWVIKKDSDGSLMKEKVLPVGFVPMIKKIN
tara:strand:- start:2444 stop:3055 length:612 start_codon:yes stop_codon:yes gene_type:complete